MIRSLLLTIIALLALAHGKRGADLSVWPKPQSMKCDVATQTLPVGATLRLNITVANSNYADGPSELATLFNEEIVDAIFDHKTAAASGTQVSIPVTVSIATYEKSLTLETDESYTLDFGSYETGASLSLNLSISLSLPFPVSLSAHSTCDGDRLQSDSKDPAWCHPRL